MAVTKTVAPQALGTGVANLYNPPANETTRNIHVANEGVVPATFSIWLGATGASAAGTALFKTVSVPIGGYVDWPYPLKLTTASFLTGQASVAATLTVTITTQLEAS